jgi:hypothetical protein
MTVAAVLDQTENVLPDFDGPVASGAWLRRRF